MNLVGYVRVSTEGQADNTSLFGQEEAIRDYNRAKGWVTVTVHQDIATGSSTNRPGLTNALKQTIAEAGLSRS